jgi:CHAD domain-containing protein
MEPLAARQRPGERTDDDRVVVDLRRPLHPEDDGAPSPTPPASLEGPPPPPARQRYRKHFRHELNLDLPLGFAVQEALLGEYDAAIDMLRSEPDRRRAVHEARKSTRRARALLRLVRDEVGYRIYREENVVLRDAARVMTTARSAAVLRQTADDAAERAGLTPARIQRLLEELDTRQAEEQRPMAIGSPITVDLTTTLACATSRVGSWPLLEAGPDRGRWTRRPIRDAFAALAPGIQRVYGRGRRAMAAAAEQPSSATYHEWRKRVRFLRFQTESLYGIWRPVMGGMAESLHQLAETLGEEHDHAELAELIHAEPGLVSDSRTRATLLRSIAEHQLDLRTGARRFGARIYHETPSDFVERLGAYWKATRLPRPH